MAHDHPSSAHSEKSAPPDNPPPNRAARRHPDTGAQYETPEEVSLRLGIPVRTLYQWHHRRIGPPVYKVGRHLRYRSAEVDAWVDDQADSGAA